MYPEHKTLRYKEKCHRLNFSLDSKPNFSPVMALDKHIAVSKQPTNTLPRLASNTITAQHTFFYRSNTSQPLQFTQRIYKGITRALTAQ
jgi:hypothetical protein